MIDFIYGFCCFLIAEIGTIFNLSYEAINVIVFCYIEPIFTGIMLLFAILALCKVPIQNIGIVLFWGAILITIYFLFIGSCLALYDISIYENNPSALKIICIKETNPIILDVYNKTIHWLENFNYSYQITNIAIYIVIMPTISIISYIILRKNDTVRFSK